MMWPLSSERLSCTVHKLTKKTTPREELLPPQTPEFTQQAAYTLSLTTYNTEGTIWALDI